LIGICVNWTLRDDRGPAASITLWRGHPPTCPETLVADEKPDTMIAGREDGRLSGVGDERPDQASLPRQLSAAPINPQSPTPLNDQNDKARRHAPLPFASEFRIGKTLWSQRLTLDVDIA
jgi:hypothetical protein